MLDAHDKWQRVSPHRTPEWKVTLGLNIREDTMHSAGKHVIVAVAVAIGYARKKAFDFNSSMEYRRYRTYSDLATVI